MRIVEKCLLLANHFFSAIVMFDISFRILLAILPFTTLLSVFFHEKLGIPGIALWKEVLIVLMFLGVLVSYVRWYLRIVWTKYDLLIGVYVAILSVITIGTTGFSGLVYGGRYDFEFLFLFLIVLHGFPLLKQPRSYYIRLFLLSAGVALFLSMLLKWPLSEDVLLYFWYSGNPSAWQFGSAVPIFHGVDGANIRRFQGIFDGPNAMGAFLLLYIGIGVYYLRYKKEWYFVIGGVVLGLFILILYTYSRSALLGFLGAIGFLIISSFGYVFRHYRKQFLVVTLLFVSFWALLALQYDDSLRAIIERGGSTQGHMERMQQGIKRVQDHPLGQGLGSAGPGYRYVQDLSKTPRTEIESLDRYYIPESWYIQQFIEWGVLWGFAFLVLMVFIFIRLYRVHAILAAMFLSVLIMNFFLHTFESSFFVLSLFSLLGLILAESYAIRKK